MACLITRCALVFALLQCCAGTAAEADWAFLDNGEIRIGVKKSSGGCIGYFSLSGTNENILNHFDQGRFLQQSYYGNRDGTFWGKQAWRWNPVQGGDYKGTAAKLVTSNIASNSIYEKTLARHWSGCVDLPEVMMEEWITLTGKLARVHFKMSYTGTNDHSLQAQEVPAVFVEPQFDTLVVYDGEHPWSGAGASRSRPGWPNESRKMTEHWAAYVDKMGFGMGAYVPIANELTCYRYGKSDSKSGACSYFAPITRFAITSGFVFEYDLYLTAGRVEGIRGAFAGLSGH